MTSETIDDHSFFVKDEDQGERLDRFLCEKLEGFSRARLKTLIKEGHVKRDGDTVEQPNYRVKCGETFDLSLPAARPAIPKPEQIPLNVLYEDEFIIVIDKPAGLVVHPAAGHWNGTLVNALISHCGESLSGIGGVRRPGIVHRLDKDTSGVMVVAKTDEAHNKLASQFADHGRTGPLERKYLAFLWGAPLHPKGTISVPLSRHSSNRLKMSTVTEGGKKGGKEAITHYKILQCFHLPSQASYPREGKSNKSPGSAAGRRPIVSLAECSLETGRTHQIRVHMAHLGHPLLADPLYGPGFKSKEETLPEATRKALIALGRQALHAAFLKFEHPIKKEVMIFESDCPDPLKELHLSLSENLEISMTGSLLEER